jgi:hypothetical protein
MLHYMLLCYVTCCYVTLRVAMLRYMLLCYILSIDLYCFANCLLIMSMNLTFDAHKEEDRFRLLCENIKQAAWKVYKQ